MCITSSRKFSILLFINFCISLGIEEIENSRIEGIHHFRNLGKRQKRFLFYKSNALNERACTCSSQQSCSCCEDVILLLIKTQRKLCANLMYQRNGLNIDISLDSNTVRSLTVTNYRPLKVCTLVPGSLFSGVCLNLVELNAFPRSLTVCPQFIIMTKNQEWRINYTCVSISTELPMANMTTAAAMMSTTTAPMSGMIVVSPGGTSRPPGQGVTPPGVTPGEKIPTTIQPGSLAALTDGKPRLKQYGATDRSKYFPSRHPPAYAANFGHNVTFINPEYVEHVH